MVDTDTLRRGPIPGLAIGKKLLPYFLSCCCSSQFSDRSTRNQYVKYIFKSMFHEILLYIKRPVDFYSSRRVLHLYKLSATKRKAQKYRDKGSWKDANKKHALQFIHRKCHRISIVNDHVSSMKKVHKVKEMRKSIGNFKLLGKDELFPTLKVEWIIKAHLAGA